MTQKEKLLRDINTLKESIQLDWIELGSKQLTPNDIASIKHHIDSCIRELKALLDRLDASK